MKVLRSSWSSIPVLFLVLFAISNSYAIAIDRLNYKLVLGPCSNYGYTAPRCIDGAPNINEEMPVNFTVAFLGDQYYGYQALAVLNLIKNENADMVIHSGDFDYMDDAELWDNNINSVLGPNFPYFASIGNHDVPAWPAYRQKIYNRLARLNISTCQGEIGYNLVCSYRGFVFVLSGAGIMGGNHVDFIENSFRRYPAVWRACSWHKLQQLMQTGDKPDEVGWQVYDTCREYGAIIATGHLHAYSRTLQMSSFENQQISDWNRDEIQLVENRTFAFVSGVGGQPALPFRPGYDRFSWWASAHASDTGLLPGALFCKFNLNGIMNRAYCYFKQRDGVIRDTFYLTSNVATQVQETNEESSLKTIRLQIEYSADDGRQYRGSSFTNCDEPSSELGNYYIGLRFRRVDLNRNSNIISARIRMTGSASYTNQATFTIVGDSNPKSPAICGQNVDLTSRAVISASVSWSPPIWGIYDNYFSPDVSQIVREINSSPNWESGDSITFMIYGSGIRGGFSADADNNCYAPVLEIVTDSEWMG